MKRIFALIVELVLATFAYGQWLSPELQKHHQELWDWTGVDRPDGMKFYECTPAFQHAARDGNLRPTYLLCHADYRLVSNDHNVNMLPLWRRPGGLNAVPRKHWRNATAVYLPGPLKVWKGDITMPGAGTLPMWKWEYPDGTIFADLLIRKYGEEEWPFELRLREKKDGKWDDGTAYRPFTGKPDGDKTEWTIPSLPGENIASLGVDRLRATAWRLRERVDKLKWAVFSPSTTIVTGHDDNDSIPPGFAGNPVRCIQCHKHAGTSQAYASVIRGNDSVFSFQPFEDSSISRNGFALPVLFNPEVIDPKAKLPTGKVRNIPQGRQTLQVIGGNR